MGAGKATEDHHIILNLLAALHRFRIAGRRPPSRRMRPAKCRRTTTSDRRSEASSWARRSIVRPGRRETGPP